ncbi:MAG TPA: DUF1801 domain-containing protein [Flavisolibacter sp.]|jgi:uncharacterized protein YdhG (YjbR/CyaY superfamily)|nr:DUF1801 domain-containing protein [Flavisolibacter sp.]
MISPAPTPEAYIESLPPDRKAAMTTLRHTIKKHLPEGFEECMSYGMIGYVVPHTLYPAGYHCNPKLPLSFLSIASQKNFIAVYHMGLYADPHLLNWFQEAYKTGSKAKPDMGKSCLRFKKPEQIPYELIGALCTKMTVAQWIEVYEKILKK